MRNINEENKLVCISRIAMAMIEQKEFGRDSSLHSG